MSCITLTALIAGTALLLPAPIVHGADGSKANAALAYPKLFSGRCIAPTYIAEGSIGADLSRMHKPLKCDSMVLTMVANHPGQIMMQFTVMHPNSVLILGFAGYKHPNGGHRIFRAVRTRSAAEIHLAEPRFRRSWRPS
jgi:hypothetical protein